MEKFSQGDVWIAKVKNNNPKEPKPFKYRPIVVVGNEHVLDIDIIANPITTHQPRNDYDVEITHWEETGLIGPSIVRTSKPFTITGREVTKKIGELHEEDLHYVLKKAREIF